MTEKVEALEEEPTIVIQTKVYQLHPNKVMRQALDGACDYRRYCWNQGLALWNEMYEARLSRPQFMVTLKRRSN